jgi:hypothetical protein
VSLPSSPPTSQRSQFLQPAALLRRHAVQGLPNQERGSSPWSSGAVVGGCWLASENHKAWLLACCFQTCWWLRLRSLTRGQEPVRGQIGRGSEPQGEGEEEQIRRIGSGVGLRRGCGCEGGHAEEGRRGLRQNARSGPKSAVKKKPSQAEDIFPP